SSFTIAAVIAAILVPFYVLVTPVPAQATLCFVLVEKSALAKIDSHRCTLQNEMQPRETLF
ncbi:MAG: hypothetical protein VXA98_02640, partial [Gammaproteobacteria bacterium]